MPRAPDCTVQVTGAGSAVVPHQEHETAVRSCSLKSASSHTHIKAVAATPRASHTLVVTRPTHADEARARWGHTDAFRESQRRAAGYAAADWADIKRDFDRVESRLAAALLEGWPADSPVAMDLAEEHRALLSRWFYECSTSLHCSLGAMYVDDERFTEHYDQRARGLAAYICAAIHANADRIG